ncbi:MAG TPA: hypothetical protein VKY36_00240 [Moheibacter sp.]|nr:hypothetical protein [Moheibacter sp.]
MDNKTAGIVSYLWWVGLAIVILTTKQRNEYVSFHIRQSLGLILCSLIVAILSGTSRIGAMIGYMAGLVLLVFWVIAFIGAINEEKKVVPVIGEKFQEWFKSI